MTEPFQIPNPKSPYPFMVIICQISRLSQAGGGGGSVKPDKLLCPVVSRHNVLCFIIGDVNNHVHSNIHTSCLFIMSHCFTICLLCLIAITHCLTICLIVFVIQYVYVLGCELTRTWLLLATPSFSYLLLILHFNL